MTWKDNYQQWRSFPDLDENLKRQLDEISGDDEALEEAFYAPLEFGTAGMRGIIGPGINRMNIYTVRQATEGLARFIEHRGEEAKERGVAIAYDSRHMSPEFSMEAAKTLASHGIKSFLFESLRATPELSFAVRHLGAFAGIMMTASHNPPAYNGFKVYDEHGGQFPPKEADELTGYVREVDNILTIQVTSEEDLRKSDLLKMVGEDVDRAYLDHLRTVTIDPDLIERQATDLKIVFTPLHGTAKMIAVRALEQAGFKHVHLVPEQAEADPDFSTVESPNPEDAAAFEMAIELGQKVDADILIATDPDADRLGMAVKNASGDYQVLTGNQIATLMIDYIIKAAQKNKTMPKNPLLLYSIVSSRFPAKIAEHYGVDSESVLTGFKFIADRIRHYEESGEKTFIFGFEESYGYLVKPFVRDKDAIQALLLSSELMAAYKEQNITGFEALEELFDQYGYFKEKTISITMAGQEGASQIKAIIANFRDEAPTHFANIKVNVSEDYQSGERQILATGSTEGIYLDRSNVLRYELEDGSWIAIRPSGTEPKIKFYIGAVADSQVAVDQKVENFERAIRSMIE